MKKADRREFRSHAQNTWFDHHVFHPRNEVYSQTVGLKTPIPKNATITPMRIAIQGQLESFHHLAAKQWSSGDAAIVPADSFAEVFGLLNRHDADAAVIAIENSLYGSINEVYDLIESHRYPIVGEVHLRVEHQLITHARDTADITHVFSQSFALAQCAEFLDTHLAHAERIEYFDTAGAVEYIATHGDSSAAAIASRGAAERYGVPILAKNIEDNPANFTRFLVIQPGAQPPADADRSSIVLVTDHTPGALAKVLAAIAGAGINLSKLQSRPIPGDPWKYRFYIVLDTAGAPLHRVIKQITPLTQSVTILGEYKHNL